MLLYLSWICFALLLLSIARYVLLLEDGALLVDALQFFLALAVVLGTFSLRRVLSNVRTSALPSLMASELAHFLSRGCEACWWWELM